MDHVWSCQLRILLNHGLLIRGQLHQNVDLKSAIESSKADLQKSQNDAKKQVTELEALMKRVEDCRLVVDLGGKTVKSIEEITKFMKLTGRVLLEPVVSNAIARDQTIKSRAGSTYDDFVTSTVPAPSRLPP